MTSIPFNNIITGNVVTDELEKCKQIREMEHKLAKVKELLVRHDKTFAEILESLSLNQMSINDLRGYLLRDK